MRPRVFPAEDLEGAVRPGDGRRASMRPRVFPAEDTGAAGDRHDLGSGFNEAAGIPRGRQPRDELEGVLPHASMRPRVFPAEDALRGAYGRLADGQASMRPRVFPAEDLSSPTRINLTP